MRISLIAIVAAAAFASPALADGHAHHHGEHATHTSSQASGCCLTVEADTVQVVVAPSREALRRVQAELAVLGFDPGHIDGIMGPRTEAALRAFQRQRGLVEGLLTTETMTALGISVRRPHGASAGSSLMGSAHTATTHHTSSCCGTGHTSVTRRHVTRVERRPATPAPATSTPQTLNYLGRTSAHRVDALQWWEKTER